LSAQDAGEQCAAERPELREEDVDAFLGRIYSSGS